MEILDGFTGTSFLEFPIDNGIPVWFFKSVNIRLGSTPREEGGKMRKSPGVATLLAAFMAAAFLFFTGCAGKGYTPGTAPDSFPCVPENKLEKDIVPEAALESLSCSFKKYEGKDTLHLNVAVQKRQRQTPAIPGQPFHGQRQSRGRSHSANHQRRPRRAGSIQVF